VRLQSGVRLEVGARRTLMTGTGRCVGHAIAYVSLGANIQRVDWWLLLLTVPAQSTRNVPLVIKQAVWPPGLADTVCPRPPLTMTFDRLILKPVCESHLRWGTFLPNLGTLGLWVLELFPIYATNGQADRQTDGWTDKSNAYCPLPCGRGHNK